MKFKLIWLTLITAFIGVNTYVTYQYRGFLTISKLPVCFLMLSYLCISLLLFNIKSKPLRAVTYTLNILVLLLAITYAIYCRRPLGFYIVFVSCVLLAKNIIAGPNGKDKTLTKIANTVILSVFAAILVITGITFSATVRDPLGNGAGILWKSEDSFFYDEIASGDTDEEKVMSAYTWMTKNITYDYDYDCLYQYSDTGKILRTKTGVCYDISCLFAAICRSQGIPCYVVDGYARTNRSIQHTWNRVCIDGTWYNVDFTHDINNINSYGFHPVDDYNSADENFVIVRMY